MGLWQSDQDNEISGITCDDEYLLSRKLQVDFGMGIPLHDSDFQRLFGD